MQDYDLEQVSSVFCPLNSLSFQRQPLKKQLLAQFLWNEHSPVSEGEYFLDPCHRRGCRLGRISRVCT